MMYAHGRAPFTITYAAPLMPSDIRTDDEGAERLYAALNLHLDDPKTWKPALHLAVMLHGKALQEPVVTRIQDAMDRQSVDGSLTDNVLTDVAVMSAALSLFEINKDVSLLRKLMLWSYWFNECVVANMTVRELRSNPADVLEVFGRLYAITGKTGFTGLCAKIRKLALDWSTTLRTYTYAKHDPADADVRVHSEALADGARTSILNGLYSGNALEQSAFRIGWEKLARYHAALCGGLTGDPVLCGNAADAPVSIDALGAWTEAFAYQLRDGKSSWAEDALSRILRNGLSRAVANASNLSVNELIRTARAFCAAFETAVMAQKDGGIMVNRPMNATYTLPLGEQKANVTVLGDECDYAVTLDTEDTHGAISLHMPAWSGESTISHVRGGACSGHAGKRLLLNADWKRGDVLHVEAGNVLTVEEGYHHAVSFYRGATLLKAEADGQNNYIAYAGGAAVENGAITAQMVRTEIPASKDMPVYPAASGEGMTVKLERADGVAAQYPQVMK